MLKNTGRLPPETIPVLEEHLSLLQSNLGDKLIGVYVHGSAAMGGFTPHQSDLDYLAIVSSPLAPDERKRLSEGFLGLHGTSGFSKGVEMSIVEERFAGRDFRYPTPYEFHMGSLEQVRHHGEPHQKEYLDPDLASHFTIARERGVCVYGKNIDAVFARIDRKYFIRSNYEDVRIAPTLIEKDPVYTILNLCRTLYGLKKGEVLSKVEGAESYLADRSEYLSLVREALMNYQSGTTGSWDRAELQKFASAMLREIEEQKPRLP